VQGEKNNADPKDVADPKTFIEAKLRKRASESRNIRNPAVFDVGYRPTKILIRSEFERLADDLADYVNLGVPKHIAVYGSRGSGKTLGAITIAEALRESRGIPYFYVNVRENPTSVKIYRRVTGLESKGHEVEYVKGKLDSMLSTKSILILDEVDFLEDYDVLYHVTRHTKANLILLTQKVYWYMGLDDESVKSSLQPDHIVFHDYDAEEMRKILTLRAEEGLVSYDESAISMLAALVVKEYRSDARIGIKALEIIGRTNRWGEGDVKSAIRQAYTEVEGETLKSLSYRDLIILQALFKNPDTNTAYTEVSRHPYFSGSPPSKSTFFQGVNYLQNLGLITLIKKKVGRSYTMEAQLLLSDPALVQSELDGRANI